MLERQMCDCQIRRNHIATLRCEGVGLFVFTDFRYDGRSECVNDSDESVGGAICDEANRHQPSHFQVLTDYQLTPAEEVIRYL